MSETQANQILRNQIAIMGALAQLTPSFNVVVQSVLTGETSRSLDVLYPVDVSGAGNDSNVASPKAA